MNTAQLDVLLTFCSRNNVKGDSLLCHAALQSERVSYTVTRPLPAEQIRSTYRMRSHSNDLRGSSIKGYPQTLAGLDAFAEPTLIVHALTTRTKTYIIFTDTSLTGVIGILESPVGAKREHVESAGTRAA